jgi:hypothetical protein
MEDRLDLPPELEPIQVRCHSGHTYADRPVAFSWEGEEVLVEEILDQWREPAGPVFCVRTARGEYILAYEEALDRWWLRL